MPGWPLASASRAERCSMSAGFGMSRSRKARTKPSGCAPMNCATALPSTNATAYGMDLRLNDATSSGLVSAFTLTSLKRPPYSRSSFSISGPSTLQGPHQGAQKSTITGTSMEASITSRSNEDSVASIMGFPSLMDREGAGALGSGAASVNVVGHTHDYSRDSSYLQRPAPMALVLNLPPGLKGVAELVVGEQHTAPRIGSGRIRVLATPVMINLIEAAALAAVENSLPEEHQSLGTRLDVSHIAATPVGMRVTATAEVVRVEGRTIYLKVRAEDERELIGEGTHERVVVNLERFDRRVQEKAKLSGGG